MACKKNYGSMCEHVSDSADLMLYEALLPQMAAEYPHVFTVADVVMQLRLGAVLDLVGEWEDGQRDS